MTTVYGTSSEDKVALELEQVLQQMDVHGVVIGEAQLDSSKTVIHISVRMKDLTDIGVRYAIQDGARRFAADHELTVVCLFDPDE